MADKPIRILYWGMAGNIGGIEMLIMNVYRNIDRTKVQIDFITDHSREKLAFEDEILSMGGKVYRVMYSETESFIKARSSLKKFFKEHNDYTAMHIHANFPYAFPLKYAKKAGIPVRIIHSHNSSKSQNLTTGIKRFVKKIRANQIKNQIKKYPNTYFACSDLAAQYMFPDEEYIWIKNGIDLKQFDFNESIRQEVRKELNIPEDCQVLGFIGRLREQKNPYFIIDIYKEYFKLNENAKLIMVGIGEMEEQVEAYSKELIDSGNIMFLGRRVDSERLYQAMDAFLLPSLFEGLPVTLVEAQAAGLPCFTSDAVTKQIAVTDIINYYPLNTGAKAWAEHIFGMVQQYTRKSYYKEMQESGFDIKDVAKGLEQFYVDGVNQS